MEQQPTFSELYASTCDAVLRYLIPRIRSSGDVEDIMQEVYRKFYQYQCRHKTIQDPLAYLYGIAKRELARFYRKKALRMAYESELFEAVLETVPDVGSLPEERISERDTADRIWAIVQKEPLLSYQAFTLYYGFDVPTAEIAQELGISEETVRKRISRTRARVREVLSQGAERK